MTQTDDMLRTLHERPVYELFGHQQERIAAALERIADALEIQVAAQEASAAFARMLTRGVPADFAVEGGFEDYREESDGLKVMVGGAWREATLAEEQEIADMNQKRRRR